MNHSLKLDAVERLISRRKQQLVAIAEKLGKDHPIVRMMGSMAWGRSDAESGGEGHSLRSACYHLGFLDGAFEMMNTWARDNDSHAQAVANGIYKRTFYVAP